MKFLARFTCAAVLALWIAAPVSADVRLPRILGSHMVLQRDVPVRLWGSAAPGEKITVRLAGKSAETTADAAGRWRTQLEALPAGGPHELTVQGNNTITLPDIFVGEVWICSGQSNMQWGVRSSQNAQEEISAANYPKVRLFTVPMNTADKSQEDCEGAWRPCSPEVIPDFSAVAYFFGRELHKTLDVPIGLVNTSWGGTICEAWTSMETLKSDPDYAEIIKRGEVYKAGNPNQPAVLYQAMIHPLTPLAIRGAIWYQGESNVSRAAQYRKLFPAMITDWRRAWGLGEFPFYFVQLAPFRYGNSDPALCAELWEAQLKTLATPGTGMAVTVDIGNTADIHPTNKQDVGKRLALWALAKNYGKADLVYSGPLYKEMAIDGNKVRIKFDHVGGGLMSRDSQPLSQFTIAGEDQKFVAAKAEIDGETVIVQSNEVAKPAAVRFAWRDDAQPNLSNKAGLPASPFRTDDFPLLTKDAK